MSRIIIFGSNGMLGKTMFEYFSEKGFQVVGLTRKDIDLSNITESNLTSFLKNDIKIEGADVIINCAGVIKQRKNVNDKDFISVNSLFPHLLESSSKNVGAKFIHITTDCVYSGKKGDYNENDLSDVNDVYGCSKYLGEPKNSTVIRTSMIGEEEYNKLSLLEWVRSNKNGKINGFSNHFWNGLTCLQLSKVVEKIIIENNFWIGIRHIFSRPVTKYELVSIINEIYNLNIDITKVEAAEKIDRTLSSIHVLNFNIPSIYKQVEETKEFHENIKAKSLKKYYDNLL